LIPIPSFKINSGVILPLSRNFAIIMQRRFEKIREVTTC